MGSFGKYGKNPLDNLSESVAARLMSRRKGFCRVWPCTAKWAAVFVIPLGALWYREVHIPGKQLERLAMIVADLPNSPRAHINYATALQDAGRADQAADEFSTALRFNPDSAKTHVSLATILMAKGNFEEAQAHFDDALRIDPNNAEYHSGHVYPLEQLGRTEEAARNAKPLCVSRQSLRSPATAMARSWKNMRSWTTQLPSIGRLYRLILVLSMPKSTSRARFSQRASWRKQRRITWRPPGSTRSLPSLITIWERFLCAKATLPRRLRNLNRRCAFIPTFRRPRKTCAWPRQATLSFLRNRPSRILASPCSGVTRVHQRERGTRAQMTVGEAAAC